MSDRASQGVSEDESGPKLKRLFESQDKQSWIVNYLTVIPDEIETIQSKIRDWDKDNTINMIVTSGGTGFGPRDVTPEAIEPLLIKKAPGLIQSMLSKSLQITPMAALSRPVAGVLENSTLIITLPGSPKGAVENLEFVLPTLPHALDLILGRNKATEKLHKEMTGEAGIVPRPFSCSHQKTHHGGHLLF